MITRRDISELTVSLFLTFHAVIRIRGTSMCVAISSRCLRAMIACCGQLKGMRGTVSQRMRVIYAWQSNC